jgi:hypothetical protein
MSEEQEEQEEQGHWHGPHISGGASRYRMAAALARNLSNKQLGKELANLSLISEQKMRQLLPTRKDKEAFVELMTVLEKETDLEAQLAYLMENPQTAGKIAIKVLKGLFINSHDKDLG